MALKRVELFENDVGVSDMVLLDPLTELAVIDNLKKRFYTDHIYTYIGSVVVSVNPYKKLTLYSPEIINEYRGRNLYELPPHIYAIADDAYRSMRDRNLDQCVIISGESGSGKTEASKYLMQYVAAVSGKGQDIDRVKEQLLQSNPVLEAFGNAKTNRNDNSSRFGKYMDIEFDFKGDPVGGVISNYLLEKSRVAVQSKGERNFHIFYQLLRSGDAGLLKSLKLCTEESKYRYLRTDSDPDNANDAKDYHTTRNAMEIIGFTNEEITSVFQLVASILKLGNVDFDHKTNKNGTDSCVVKNDREIQEVSEMLQCDVSVLKKALTKKTVETIEDKYDIDLRVTEAVYARDALCKAMYGRLFTWVVNRINDSIRVVSKEQRKCMGVLDIYGFEIFETNAFEQFIINYCNEKLQQIFIELTLKEEQEEYVREDIQWVNIEYFNNSVICDLVEKPPLGILTILDEECLRPGNVTDLTFLEKLNHHHEFHKHYESRQCRKAQNDKTLPHDSFRIHHYAGLVTYNVEGFIDKNNDLLFRDLSQAMFKCRLPLLKKLFPEGQGKGSLKRPPTTGTQLRQSIAALMKNLYSKNPNYIRCIKPNDHKRAGFFEESLVRHQVRYLGLLENIRVRRAGYVYRQEYELFINRYKMLCDDTWPHWHNDPKEGLQLIFNSQAISKEEYTFGRTKAFIRNPQTIFILEERRRAKMNDLATVIQKIWRGYALWKKYRKMKDAQIVIAANYKGYKARTQFHEKKNAAIVIASYARGWQARKLLRQLKLKKKQKWAVGVIVKCFLGWQVRKVFCRHFRKHAGPVVVKCFKNALIQKYLYKLAENLPSLSPLDTFWMECPARFNEASEQLRALHHRWRCGKHRAKFDKNQQYSMREKVTASDLFKDKKLNYAKSVPHEFVGDYVQIRQNAKWKRISIEHDDQYVVFADICQKINRKNGKFAPTLVVITTKSLLLMDQRTVGLKYKVPVNEIEKLSLSPLNDKLLFIHFRKNGTGNRLTAKGDFFLSCDHIFEIAAKIYLVVQEHCSKPPDVQIATRFHAQFKGNLCEVGFKPGTDNIGLVPGQCKIIRKSNRFDILEP